MEPPTSYYDSSDVVLTHLGNKVSRRCSVYGTQNIVLSGQVSTIFKFLYETR